MTQTFKLKDEFIPLNKLLKVTGLCESGGLANQAILEERVRVNGQIERRKRYKTKSGDIVELAGEIIQVLGP